MDTVVIKETFSHPDDQTVIGPYRVDHSAPRKEYAIRATKRRTGGTVLIAVFKYRTNSQLLYLPTQSQASATAELCAYHFNSLRLKLNDGR